MLELDFIHIRLTYTNGMSGDAQLSGKHFDIAALPDLVRKLIEKHQESYAITQADFDYDQLDPGIRRTVRWLHSIGYPTQDSGDGVSKPAPERDFDVPHVVIPVEPEYLISVTQALNSELQSVSDGGTAEATYSAGAGLVVVYVGDAQLVEGLGEVLPKPAEIPSDDK